jgi:hypothetical protein
MTAGDIAALFTAIGMSTAAIITAIAALRNANASAKRVDDLQKENERLKTDDDAKTKHNEHQDAVILDQAIKIEKWHEWGDRIGREFNQMQLRLGMYEAAQARAEKRDKHATGPLPKLPAEKEIYT